MKRRDFIQKAGVVGAGALLLPQQVLSFDASAKT
ncbi:MAG: twin-arginine translocation signal domain-containing protein, partial [Flavobacteriia bacterium]